MLIDPDAEKLEHVYLTNGLWTTDILCEDLDEFRGGWEAPDPEEKLTVNEEIQLNGLLDTLCAGAADVETAIRENREAYDRILSCGKKGLWWAMEELYFSKDRGIKTDILGKICRDIMASLGEVYEMEPWYEMTGKIWLGQLEVIAEDLSVNKTAFYIRDNHPGVWILLNTKYNGEVIFCF